MRKLVKIAIPSQVHKEMDTALDRVDKLLANPAQLKQEEGINKQRWQIFEQRSPMAVALLAQRWRKDRFAESVLALFLTGKAPSEVFEWLSRRSEDEWKEFMEIMKANPTMNKWVKFHSQPATQEISQAQARQREEEERRRRLIYLQQQQQKIRIR